MAGGQTADPEEAMTSNPPIISSAVEDELYDAEAWYEALRDSVPFPVDPGSPTQVAV
jgi:hypothetical protein